MAKNALRANIKKNRRGRRSYRMMMLKGGKWERGTNCGSYEDAEIAARDLITDGTAMRVHIVEIGKNGERIVAEVGAVKKLGWPHSKVEVRKF